eukprot:UN17385
MKIFDLFGENRENVPKMCWCVFWQVKHYISNPHKKNGCRVHHRFYIIHFVLATLQLLVCVSLPNTKVKASEKS